VDSLRSDVFADSSAWYAVTNRRDGNHSIAVQRFDRLTRQGRSIITTNYVISETYTLLRTRAGFDPAWEFLRRIHTSTRISRIYVPENWEEDVERLLAQFDDQVFSYVDATSFVTLRRLGIHEAFSFDRDFLIAGFALMGDA
jgi:predicted nucleic acid-binding protein